MQNVSEYMLVLALCLGSVVGSICEILRWEVSEVIQGHRHYLFDIGLGRF